MLIERNIARAKEMIHTDRFGRDVMVNTVNVSETKDQTIQVNQEVSYPTKLLNAWFLKINCYYHFYRY